MPEKLPNTLHMYGVSLRVEQPTTNNPHTEGAPTMAAIAPERPLAAHPASINYTELADRQQAQLDHLLDLLDTATGLTDTVQRRTVSLIAAQIAGIDLPPGQEIATCTECAQITARRDFHETADATLCDDCHHQWALATDETYTGRL